jgi:O-antigen ligase
MLAELKKVRFPVETGLLLAFCIFLPLVEMPKNLAWLLYVGAWLINRVRSRDFGGRWDGWDTLFALWIASGYLVAAFAGLQGSELGGAHELARYALLGWLVKRAGYSAKEMYWILGALVASTVVGLAQGYWNILSGGSKSRALQLHSVGHVNHTAIYLAIVLGLCAAWLFARWRAWSTGRRATALAVCGLMLVSLVVTASRGAVGVGLALVLALAAAWWSRWRVPFVASLVVVVLSAVAVVGMKTELVRKQEVFAAMDNTLSSRDGIWRMALVAWERYPLFGIGMDNYSQLTYERVRAWRTEAGKDYDQSRYVQHAHAHNLFINALAERGSVGFAALAAVMLAWMVGLIRRRPRPSDDDVQWLVWGAAASAWMVTVGVGMVNTTLHHEHGLLAALLLGLWLSTRSPHRAPS